MPTGLIPKLHGRLANVSFAPLTLRAALNMSSTTTSRADLGSWHLASLVIAQLMPSIIIMGGVAQRVRSGPSATQAAAMASAGGTCCAAIACKSARIHVCSDSPVVFFKFDWIADRRATFPHLLTYPEYMRTPSLAFPAGPLHADP